VCDTAARYTHRHANTVFGIPKRLDDDLAANARHARVWRGGARTVVTMAWRRDPLRNVEPCASGMRSLSESTTPAICTSLATRRTRGPQRGGGNSRPRVRRRARQARGARGGLCSGLSCSSQAATSDYPETPLSPSDSAPLDFSHRSYARLPYRIRDTFVKLSRHTKPAPANGNVVSGV
jgi:hypothetical protein